MKVSIKDVTSGYIKEIEALTRERDALAAQVEQLAADRDAFAIRLDDSEEQYSELHNRNSALAAKLAKIDRAWADAGGWPDTAEEIEEICGAITSSPQQCLRDVQAEAIEAAISSCFLYADDVLALDELKRYAAKVRQGGAE